MKSDIYEKIAIYCENNQLFEQGDGVIAGLSGGADSVFLLWVLWKLRERWKLRIEAVHVNHGIRGEEAVRDQEFSVSFAESLGIACRVVSVDVPALSKEWQMTEEEAGRTCRYQCFEKLRQELAFEKIAVAHHRDDQAETILFQLLRGSSLRGLGGMRPKRDVVVRPLLEVGRSDIEKSLEKEGIRYCTDSTNNQDDYARNLIRHHVMPYLQEKIQPAAAMHIAQTGAHLREVMDYVDTQSEAAFRILVARESGKLVMEEERYRELAGVIQRELLLRMILELAGRKKDITVTHIELIQAVFAGDTGKSVMLPYCLRAEKSYGKLLMYQWEGEAEKVLLPEEEIEFQKEYRIPLADDRIYKVRFEKMQRENLSNFNRKNHCTKCFDYDRMVCMPIFRYPQEGDYLWLDLTGKTKKLSRLFIDEKVEKGQRERIVVLAEGHHILWVPALNRCSAYYYITEDTQMVVLANMYE